MNIVNLYYCAGLPFLTCNLLFYSITLLSTSITSSQNVFNFIYEIKDSDYDIYKKQIEITDLENKLKIVKSLIHDIINSYAHNKHESNLLIEEILNPNFISSTNLDFELIDINLHTNILSRLPKPLMISLISLSNVIEKINRILITIQNKIKAHEKLYFKNYRSFCLKNEITNLKHHTDILNSRFNILFQLIGAYNIKFNKKLEF